MQCACTILPPVGCPVLQYYLHSDKQNDFQEKVIEHNICGLIFYPIIV
jgi:hypothetical protein